MHPPVIIIGTGRSGTSTLYRVFRNTLGYQMAYEPRFISPHSRRSHGDLTRHENQRKLLLGIAAWLDQEGRLDVDQALAQVARPTYAGVVLAGMHAMASLDGKCRVGWKDPADSLNIERLNELFHDALYIHIMRNAHDVAASLASRTWGPTNAYTGGIYWRNTIQAIWKSKSLLGKRFLEIKFEDLFERPEQSAEILASFVSSERAADTLEYLVRKRDLTRLNVWRRTMSSDDRRLVEAAAQGTLIAAGYETEFFGAAQVSSAEASWLVAKDRCKRVVRRLVSWG